MDQKARVKKRKRLKGQALADVYALMLKAHIFHDFTEEDWKNQPYAKIWGYYSRGGWIEVRGESLPAAKSMRKLYPNGWSLGHRVRVGQARRELREAAR